MRMSMTTTRRRVDRGTLRLDETPTPAGQGTAPALSPWGVWCTPAPAGYVALTAIDEQGAEVAFLRCRADGWEAGHVESLHRILLQCAPFGPRRVR